MKNHSTHPMKEHASPRTAAILLVAEGGNRCGCQRQFVSVLGMPLFMHSLRAHQLTGCIDELILIIPPEYVDPARMTVKDAGAHKLDPNTGIIAGDPSRHRSVGNALEALASRGHEGCPEFVVISDADRPLVTPNVISTVCAHAYSTESAATAATSSISAMDPSTPREQPTGVAEWESHREGGTPLCAPYVMLLEAHRRAERSDGESTSEPELLFEMQGISCDIIEFSRLDMWKVGLPEDRDVAECLLQFRNRSPLELPA